MERVFQAFLGMFLLKVSLFTTVIPGASPFYVLRSQLYGKAWKNNECVWKSESKTLEEWMVTDGWINGIVGSNASKEQEED